jgi:hypothetical protein
MFSIETVHRDICHAVACILFDISNMVRALIIRARTLHAGIDLEKHLAGGSRDLLDRSHSLVSSGYTASSCWVRQYDERSF